MLVRNATLADGRQRDVRVTGETITAVGRGVDSRPGERVIDATGKRLLPGMVDAHVRFREPGNSHKETWTTGSKSAAAGGVTTVVDQPDTTPPTVDGAGFDTTFERAMESIVDFGINGGVTGRWDPGSLFERDLFALGEVAFADSTADMGIGEELFVRALDAAGDAGVPVTVHAEDADLFNLGALERDDADAWSAYRVARAEVVGVREACRLAAEQGTRIHVAGASTPRSIDAADRAGMTCEVTPHHMLLSRRDLAELGTHGRTTPPLRREKRRQRVYRRVVDGTVDTVASDHVPHTREEKTAGVWDAPSGVPGVETTLPLLLAEVQSGDLGYERVRDLTAANPAEVFGLPTKGRVAEGYHADLVLVDPERTHEVRPERLHTNCDWTPFEGWTGVFPELTVVRGTVVYERDPDDPPGGDSETFVSPIGENVRAVGDDGHDAGGRSGRQSSGQSDRREAARTDTQTGTGTDERSVADLAAEVVESDEN